MRLRHTTSLHLLVLLCLGAGIAPVPLPLASSAEFTHPAAEPLWTLQVGGSGTDVPLKLLRNGDRYYIIWKTVTSNDMAFGDVFDSTFGGGYCDVAVSCVQAGELLWTAYYGGYDWDECYDATLGPNDEIVIVGQTSSYDLPTTADAFQPGFGGYRDGFVAAISPDGQDLVYSSYYGDENSNGLGYIEYIEGEDSFLFSGGGAAIETTPGVVHPDPLPGYENGPKLVKFSGDFMDIIWATYSSCAIASVRARPTGDIVVYGRAGPVYEASDGGINYGSSDYDLSVFEIANDASVYHWRARLGGESGVRPEPTDFELGEDGTIVLLSHVHGGEMPVTEGAFDIVPDENGRDDAYIALISADGDSLLFGMYLGGQVEPTFGYSDDKPRDVFVNAGGSVFVVGSTVCTDFPVTPNALQSELAQIGSWDGFWTLLDSSGSYLRFSTYWGGETAYHCSALLTDGLEIALLGFAMIDGDPDALLTLYDAASVPVEDDLEVQQQIEDCHVTLSIAGSEEIDAEDLRVIRHADSVVLDLSDQLTLGPVGPVLTDPLSCTDEVVYDIYVLTWDSHTPWRTISVEGRQDCCAEYRPVAVPNPSSSSVRLRLPTGVDDALSVSIDLFDVRGHKVRSWVARPADSPTIDWDGRDSTGRMAPAGTYFFRVDDGSRVFTEKIVKLR